MKRLVVFGLVGLSLTIACGESKKSPKQAATPITTETTTETSEKQDGTEDCYSTGTCVPVVPVVTTPVLSAPVTGAGMPAHYTFITTPNANVCVDAFNRMGVFLPDNTVARTLNFLNKNMHGIAVQDFGASAIPVMNILTIETECSDVMFQFLNPNGYYCIVSNNAVCSNVTVQRSCTSQLTQIEPITNVNVNTSRSSRRSHFGDTFEDPTTSAINSTITETPCIP